MNEEKSEVGVVALSVAVGLAAFLTLEACSVPDSQDAGPPGATAGQAPDVTPEEAWAAQAVPLAITVGSVGADLEDDRPGRDRAPISVSVINIGPEINRLTMGLSYDGRTRWNARFGQDVEWQVAWGPGQTPGVDRPRGGPLREGIPGTGAGDQALVEFSNRVATDCRELVAQDITATGHVREVQIRGDRYIVAGQPPLAGACP